MGHGLTPSALEPVEPATLTGGAPIVVLAPHPDDESLGCGALLAHAFAGHGAHVICMTDGAASHPGSRQWPPARLAAERRRELSRAVGILGGASSDLTCLGHPDGWLGAQDQGAVAARIAGICRDFGARHLFAPSHEDHHEDHKSTARIARLAADAVPGLVLYSYPLWSRWDDPDLMNRNRDNAPVALAPTPWAATKRAAIAAHATQLGHVVRDDPAGFSMSKAFVDTFADHPEIYWRATA